MIRKTILSLLLCCYASLAYGAVFTENVTGGCDNYGNITAVFEPNEHTCAAGYYLPANTDSCAACPSGHTCHGGTFTFNEFEDEGIIYTVPITTRVSGGCALNLLSTTNNTAQLGAVFEPNEHTCSSGYYLPANNDGCVICPADSYCPGGTFTFNEFEDDGIDPCPDGTYSNAGSSDESQCGTRHTCATGYYLPANSTTCATCPANSYCVGGTYIFNSTTASGATACPTGYTSAAGATAISQCQITCPANTYIASGAYTRLEYLESTGTQYIITGFVPNADFKHTLVFELTTSDNVHKYLCGSSAASGGRIGNVRIEGNTISAIYIGNGNSINILNDAHIVNGKTTLVMDLHNNAPNTVMINGQNVANNSTGAVISSGPLLLFNIGSSYIPTGARIYSSVIEQNNALIKNLIPVRRNSDNELGMLDLVTGTFFTNAGTGTFIAGPDAPCGPCATGYSSTAHTVNYGSASSCTPNTITINWGGADGVFETGSCNYDGSITTPTTIPTRRGYIFTGWTFTNP